MPRRFVQCCVLLLAFCFAGCNRNSPDSSGDPARNQSATAPQGLSDQFISLMNAGKNYFDQGDATNALVVYKKAAAIVPNDLDVHLNLANAYLMAEAATDAIREADEVLKLDPNSEIGRAHV